MCIAENKILEKGFQRFATQKLRTKKKEEEGNEVVKC